MLGTGNALGQTALYAGRRFAPRPLDAFASQIAMAFGMQRLLSTHNGPCRRVVRSSDNAALDIGFLPTGAYDLAAEQAHVGANSGAASIWYDQSAAVHDGAQGTAASRPRTINAGTPDVGPDGAAVLAFDGANDALIPANALGVARAADALTIAFIGRSDLAANSGVVIAFGKNGTTSWYRTALLHTPTLGGGTLRLLASGNDADNPPAVAGGYTAGGWMRVIARVRFLDGAMDITVNGVTTTAALPTTTPTPDTDSANVRIGTTSNASGPWLGTMRALIVLRGAPSIAALDAALAKLG